MDSVSKSSILGRGAPKNEARARKLARRAVDEGKICTAMEYSNEIGGLAGNIPVVGSFVSAGIAAINFFVGHSLKSSCGDKPFDEVKQIMENRFDKVDKALDRQYKIMKSIEQAVSKTRHEIQQGFGQVLDSLRNSRVEPLVLNLNTFIRSFNNERERIKNAPQDEYIAKLKEPDNILLELKSSRQSKENNLHQSLHQIIEGNYAIPKDENDKTAINALRALIYGTQTYISVMFFLIEQFLYLAHYSYEKRDLDEFNYYYDLVKSTFKDFKGSLVDKSNSDSLIPKVVKTLHTIKSKYSDKCDEETCEFVSNQITFLDNILIEIQNMRLPIIYETPDMYTGKIKFKDTDIKTPIGQWKRGANVYYALQYENNGVYSKLGEWSNPYTVGRQAIPFITLKYDPKYQRKLIFRRFNREVPQLVAIIESETLREVRDINRDLFNAASISNEDIAMREMNILLKNGALITAAFEHGRRAIHAAAEADNVKLAKNYILGSSEDVNVGDEEGYTPMHIAAEAGHEDFIAALMDHKANVNVKTKSELLTPLHLAAKKGNAPVIEILTKSNLVNVNEKENSGFTPLHSAVTGGIPAVEALVSISNTDINAKSNKGLTPLHLTTIKNDQRIAEILSKTRRLDVNAGDVNNMTPLHFATMLGNLDMVKYLIGQNGIKVNVVSKNNWAPLHFAIYLKRSDIVSTLLEMRDINVNLIADGNISPLHIAVESGQNSIAIALLEKQAKKEEKTKEGLTALHIAAKNKNKEMVSVLIEKGANIEAKSNNGSTPLHFASAVGSVEIVKLLLDKGVNVKEKDDSGEVPVHVAVVNGKTEVVQLLVNSNPSLLNIKNLRDNSLLHLSVKNPKLDIIKFLIDEGIDLNSRNQDMKTPLHLVTMDGNLPLVKYLVERRADVHTTDAQKYTAIYLAAQRGYLDIIKYLLENRVDLQYKDVTRSGVKFSHEAPTTLHYILTDAIENGKFNVVEYFTDANESKYKDFKNWCDLLTKAAEHGELKIVKYFVEVHRFNVDCEDAQKYYPLWLAISEGHIDTVRYLVEHKANQNSKALGDNTPLRKAVEVGRLDIVKYLLRERAMIDLPVRSQDTILHDAAVYNRLDIVKYLVEEKNMNVNEQNSLKDTPLHNAAQHGFKDVFDYLKEHGGRVDIKNSRNKTPLQIMQESGKSYFKRSIRDNPGNSKLNLLYPRQNSISEDENAFDEEKYIDSEHEQFHWKNDFAPEVINIVEGISHHSIPYPLLQVEDASGTQPLGKTSFGNVNFNSTLLLLDLLARKVTGEKY